MPLELVHEVGQRTEFLKDAYMTADERKFHMNTMSVLRSILRDEDNYFSQN